MSEDRLQSKINRGQKAAVLLNDEAFSTACKALEAEYIKAWAATQRNDTSGREALWMACQVLSDVRGHLALMHSDGKLSARELEDLIKRRPRAA